ncbi:GntR family transcriptional regulator, partial [Klebsiella pneumoniae]|nr:GntR family transcriptional regulator [Klebsiella pneumoniae]
PKLGKIKLLSAKEQVAAVLRKAILSRDLVEGREITLEGIARLVGVSSMPVREAFQILAADGLIQVRPNKGA